VEGRGREQEWKEGKRRSGSRDWRPLLTQFLGPFWQRLVYTKPLQWRRNQCESRWGGTGPERKWGGIEKNIFGVPLHFLAPIGQLVVLASAFAMVSTVWSVSFLLFYYSRCPPCPMESTPLTAFVDCCVHPCPALTLRKIGLVRSFRKW